jgi:polyisoprenoid-binding protein YceI
MKRQVIAMILAMGGVIGLGAATSADNYRIDPVHSGVNFHVLHEGVSYIPGRFNQFSGELKLDRTDPARSSFRMTIELGSVDTNNEKRDKHLKGPDFFNAVEFPRINFTSTAVKKIYGGYLVTGDLNLHGKTHQVSFVLGGGRVTQNLKTGLERTGYTTQFKVRRSDYGIGPSFLDAAISNEIVVTITIEAEKSEK